MIRVIYVRRYPLYIYTRTYTYTYIEDIHVCTRFTHTHAYTFIYICTYKRVFFPADDDVDDDGFFSPPHTHELQCTALYTGAPRPARAVVSPRRRERNRRWCGEPVAAAAGWVRRDRAREWERDGTTCTRR